MESAKNAVKEFLHKSNKHDTDVHQTVAPAVKHENIERQEREEVTTAVDKEIHQDHHHTTVQPVRDSEVLPEQHHHKAIPIEHREFEHNDAEATKRRLAEQSAQFKDSTTRTDVGNVDTKAAAVGGSHVHHHVHETIQPVVEKQTIEPHVVHTTVPVHEVHHNVAQHHDTTTLPAVTMDQFKQGHGALSGQPAQVSRFDGEPTHTAGKIGGTGEAVPGHNTHGAGVDSTSTGVGKPSLKEKLDPRIDADGDGKKGFLD